MRRLWFAVLALLPMYASSAVREITRAPDVGNLDLEESIAWYAGEEVVYAVTAKRGDDAVAIPTNASVVWTVFDGTNTCYVQQTGTVVNAASGEISFALSAVNAALPAGEYESYVAAYAGTNTLLGILDKTTAKVTWLPGVESSETPAQTNWEAVVYAVISALYGQPDLNVRLIDRSPDVDNFSHTDSIQWYAGESILYRVSPKRGDTAVAVPFGSAVVWTVMENATTCWVQATGTVKDVFSGQAEFFLEPARSALPEGATYDSYVAAYAGTNLVGILDRTFAEVKWRPGTEVEPAAAATNWLEIVQALIPSVYGDLDDELNAHYADPNAHGVTAAALGAATTQQLAAAVAPMASTSYVAAAIGAIQIPSTNNLASTNWVASAFADRITQAQLSAAIAPLVTSNWVANAIAALGIPSTNGLASTSYVANAIAAIDFPAISGYATTQQLAAAVAAASNAIPSTNGLASTQYVAGAMAAISHPTNGFATTQYVANAVANIDIPSITGFATTGYVGQLVAAASNAIPSTNGLASTSYVAGAVAAITHPTNGLATTQYVANAAAAVAAMIPPTNTLASTTYVASAVAAWTNANTNYVRKYETKKYIGPYEFTAWDFRSTNSATIMGMTSQFEDMPGAPSRGFTYPQILKTTLNGPAYVDYDFDLRVDGMELAKSSGNSLIGYMIYDGYIQTGVVTNTASVSSGLLSFDTTNSYLRFLNSTPLVASELYFAATNPAGKIDDMLDVLVNGQRDQTIKPPCDGQPHRYVLNTYAPTNATVELRFSPGPPNPPSNSAPMIIVGSTMEWDKGLFLRGLQNPDYYGNELEFHGQVLLVDDPEEQNAVANLHFVDSAKTEAVNSAKSEIWSRSSATSLNEFPLYFGNRFSMAENGEALTIYYGLTPVMEISGGGVVVPKITSLSMSANTQIVTIVATALTNELYEVNWATNAADDGWHRIGTNAITQTAGDEKAVQLVFTNPAPAEPSALYGIAMVTANSGEAKIRSLGRATTGAGDLPLATESYVDAAVSNAILPEMLGYATTQLVAETVAPLATTSFVANAISLLGETIPSTNNLVSTQRLAAAIAAVSNAIPSTNVFASTSYVAGAVAAIGSAIPSTNALASTTYVANAVSALGATIPSTNSLVSTQRLAAAIASVSNSIPTTNGLASTSYVANAVALIQHPTNNLASTTYVVNAVSALGATIPSTNSLVSTQLLNAAIASLSNAMPSTNSMATTSWVVEAMADMASTSLLVEAISNLVPYNSDGSVTATDFLSVAGDTTNYFAKYIILGGATNAATAAGIIDLSNYELTNSVDAFARSLASMSYTTASNAIAASAQASSLSVWASNNFANYWAITSDVPLTTVWKKTDEVTNAVDDIARSYAFLAYENSTNANAVSSAALALIQGIEKTSGTLTNIVVNSVTGEVADGVASVTIPVGSTITNIGFGLTGDGGETPLAIASVVVTNDRGTVSFGTLGATDVNVGDDLTVHDDVVIYGDLAVMGVASNVTWEYYTVNQDYRTNIYTGTNYYTNDTVIYTSNNVYLYTNIIQTTYTTQYVDKVSVIGGNIDYSEAGSILMPYSTWTNGQPLVASGTWDFSGATMIGALTNETYLGTITGATVAEGALAVATNAGVLAFTIPAAGAGAPMNLIAGSNVTIGVDSTNYTINSYATGGGVGGTATVGVEGAAQKYAYATNIALVASTNPMPQMIEAITGWMTITPPNKADTNAFATIWLIVPSIGTNTVMIATNTPPVLGYVPALSTNAESELLFRSMGASSNWYVRRLR